MTVLLNNANMGGMFSQILHHHDIHMEDVALYYLLQTGRIAYIQYYDGEKAVVIYIIRMCC